MALFLVLNDAATPGLYAGAVIDDDTYEGGAATLAANGVALVSYSSPMDPVIAAFFALAEPRGAGDLVALLIAAGLIGGGSGSGDVVGPAGATDNTLPRWNGPTGKLLQGSTTTLDDAGNLSTPGTVNGRNLAADAAAAAATAAALTAHIGAGGAAHAAATPSVAGFMSAADKTAHDAVVADAVRDGDFPGTYTADLARTGAGAYTGLRNNLAAAVAPTVTDDSSASYAVGSRWIDTVADRHWICVDATAGAAVWLELGDGLAPPEYVRRRIVGDYDPIVGLPIGDPLATLVGSAGLGRVALFRALSTFTPASIGIYCTNAIGGGSQIELVIYNEAVGGGTGPLIWSSGALALVTNTRASSAVGMPTLVRGRTYWVGAIFNDGSTVRALPTGSLWAIRGMGTAPSGATRGTVANAFGLTVGTPPNPFVIGAIGFGAVTPCVEALT